MGSKSNWLQCSYFNEQTWRASGADARRAWLAHNGKNNWNAKNKMQFNSLFGHIGPMQNNTHINIDTREREKINSFVQGKTSH